MSQKTKLRPHCFFGGQTNAACGLAYCMNQIVGNFAIDSSLVAFIIAIIIYTELAAHNHQKEEANTFLTQCRAVPVREKKRK